MPVEEPDYKIENRPGWSRECPYCRLKIFFTKLVNQYEMAPFFYSDGSNDVLLRASDRERVRELLAKGQPTIEELTASWNDCLRTAPPAPSGGQFSFWANIKCASCGTEFPYNNGIRDHAVRLHEPYIILIDRAVVVGDTASESWRVSVNVEQSAS